MAFVLDKVSEDTFYENIFLGLTKVLEKNHRIKNVHLERQLACHATEVAIWEQMNNLKLPEEVKDFYLASNGMNLTWSYTFSGNHEVLQVGLLKIRSLSELNLINKVNLQIPSELKSLKNKLYPYCNGESKVVYFANVDDTSKVCMVYGTNSRIPPNIYLIENDTMCYFLTNSFKKYLLMAIAHLGLPLWQFAFTPQGVPSWVEQMFIMTAPHLEVAQPIIQSPDHEIEEEIDFSHYQINKLDSSIFKNKRSNKIGECLKYRKKH